MKRIMALACAVALLLTLSVFRGKPAMADGEPDIVLGTGKLAKWAYVYFGGKGETVPLDNAWRVLQTGSGKVMLIYAQTMDQIAFRSSGTGNAWAGSNAQTWCKNLYADWAFPAEKAAIAATTINEGTSNYTVNGYNFKPVSISDEHFFFLSAKEADQLFLGNSDRITENFYWLRSPDADNADNASRVVGGFGGNPGGIYTCDASGLGYTYARPVFHLQLAPVFFLSPAVGGKPAGTLSTMTKIVSTGASQWKITFADSTRSFASPADSLATEPGDKIRIPYTGAKTGGREYISVLLCSSTGTTALYYASIPATRESGFVAFSVPAGFPEGDYVLKVFNEQKNPDKMSDYSSMPKNIPLKIADLDWADPTYAWAEDCSTVTAKRISRNYPDIFETETVAAAGTVTVPATESATGVMTYTSDSFYNPAFKVQTITRIIPALPPADPTTPPVEPTQAPDNLAPAVGALKYKISGSNAIVTGPKDKNAKKLTIPKTISANGKTYKVTEIKANAFKGMKKLTTVTIGENVKTIGKNAFNGCAKLKTITIKTKKLTASSVKSSAFKGIYKKATFKCPKGKAEAYKKILLKKGAPKTCKFK